MEKFDKSSSTDAAGVVGSVTLGSTGGILDCSCVELVFEVSKLEFCKVSLLLVVFVVVFSLVEVLAYSVLLVSLLEILLLKLF